MGKKGKAGNGTTKTEKRQKSRNPTGSGAAPKISRAQRLQMIRTAAYHLAEKRGFKPGAEMDDWLEAEQDLKATPTEED